MQITSSITINISNNRITKEKSMNIKIIIVKMLINSKIEDYE